MRECVVYIQIMIRCWMWPRHQFIRLMTWLCFFSHNFSSLYKVILSMFGTWEYPHGTMCGVHSWLLFDLDLWPQYENYILTMNLSLARPSLLFDISIPNMAWVVSPWDNMLYTFVTLVWPWPLTYMWVTGLSLVSFLLTNFIFFVMSHY